MIKNTLINKYDKAIIMLLCSLALGSLYIGFGALQYSRILALLFVPMLLPKITKSKYIKSLLFFLLFVILYGMLSLLWTASISKGVEELLYYIVHFLFLFEILVFSMYAINPIKSISIGWLLSLLITLVIAIWEITTGKHLSMSVQDSELVYKIGREIINRQFASVTFGNYNSYVTFICMALPFIFYFLLGKNKKKYTFYSIIVLILSACVILFNSSRGGILCLVSFLFLYIIKASSNKMTLLFICLSALIAFTYFGESLFVVIFDRASDGGMFEDNNRMQVYSNAIQVCFDTLGLGAGLGGVHLSMSKFSNNNILAVHNMFLEILVQFGVVIFMFFVTFIVRLFLKSFRIKDLSRRIVAYMIFISLPILSIIDSSYLLSTHFFAYISSIIIFVNYEQIRPIDKNL